MNIDPREQAHAYDDWHVEDVPEPEMPEDRSEVRQVPEAVAAGAHIRIAHVDRREWSRPRRGVL